MPKLKELKNKVREKDSDGVTLEFKFLCKIWELPDKIQETDIDEKNTESALRGQREYYERKLQERNATTEKVEVDLCSMLNKLYKQLPVSEPQVEATLHRQSEELHTILTETHFERERATRRIKELEHNVREKDFDRHCGSQPPLHN